MRRAFGSAYGGGGESKGGGDPMKLKGRTAIITGGSRGIGKAISLALASEGANVVINYRRDEDAARQTVAEVEAFGVKTLSFQADIGDHEQVKEMVSKTVDSLGKVDILINNAGIATRNELVGDINIKGLRRMMDTDFWGPLHCTQAVLPSMRQQTRGDIIFISTAQVISRIVGSGDYVAAKSAMEAIADVLAKEERPNGIRVNVIRPGVTETDLAVSGIEFLWGAGIAELRPFAAFGRLVQPSDVANMVLFLVSQEGSLITGRFIAVNGGATTMEETFPG
jgi:NAD(P)-dependent dehydrogenase (short-subunit alcohol dehydrogenase family)